MPHTPSICHPRLHSKLKMELLGGLQSSEDLCQHSLIASEGKQTYLILPAQVRPLAVFHTAHLWGRSSYSSNTVQQYPTHFEKIDHHSHQPGTQQLEICQFHSWKGPDFEPDSRQTKYCSTSSTGSEASLTCESGWICTGLIKPRGVGALRGSKVFPDDTGVFTGVLFCEERSLFIVSNIERIFSGTGDACKCRVWQGNSQKLHLHRRWAWKWICRVRCIAKLSWRFWHRR